MCSGIAITAVQNHVVFLLTVLAMNVLNLVKVVDPFTLLACELPGF